MPIWALSMTNDERWLVALYVKHAYMDMVPHYTDEGDLPKAYDLPNPTKVDTETLTAGKALYTANCSYCHGYSGHGMGPSATGVPLYPGLLPQPPNFEETATYAPWKWGDYYWRISESIPMRPMMPWKEMWPGEQGSPGSLQRWYLADYVRDMLIFPKETNEPSDADTPPKFEPLKMPATANAARGRLIYFRRCWLCHGAGGQGEGQQGQNLRPVPANFTDPDVAKMVDGRWFWRVSAGVDGAAMPIWHLLLSQQDEWDAIAYIKTTYVFPGAAADPNGLAEQRKQLQEALRLQLEGAVEYQALTSPYTNDAAAIADGKTTYEAYCAECHGAAFKGDGEIGKKLTPKPTDLTSAAAKAKPVDDWYSAVAQGKPGGSMAPYKMFIADQQVWNVVWYTRQALGIKEPAP
jgi:mono/diheme cytochrome c family protein